MKATRWGLGEFGFKLIACACMTMGHIGTYLPGASEWCLWVGRMALPMFLYQVGWSCIYTCNKRNYLLRLYGAGIVMAIVDQICQLNENIFLTLFNVAVILCILSVQDRRRKLRYMAGYAMWQVGAFAILTLVGKIFAAMIPAYMTVMEPIFYVVGAASGSVILAGYGLFAVVIGIVFGLCRSGPHLAVTFSMLELIDVLMHSVYGHMLVLMPQLALPKAGRESLGMLGEHLYYAVFRDGMVLAAGGNGLLSDIVLWSSFLALPLILLYGGRRILPADDGARGSVVAGEVSKWCFYAYYPLHLAVLAVIGRALGSGIIF